MGWKALGFAEGFPKKVQKKQKLAEPLIPEQDEKQRPVSAQKDQKEKEDKKEDAEDNKPEINHIYDLVWHDV